MSGRIPFLYVFFFNDTATTEIYTLSLHDALPISIDSDLCGPNVWWLDRSLPWRAKPAGRPASEVRSEEHTSELQSRSDLVCRLLLEKKKNTNRPRRQRKHRHHATTRTHMSVRRPH